MGIELPKKGRLIKENISGSGEGTLTDYTVNVMFSLEEALLLAGATPKDDYDVMYLMELAQPYVLAYNANNELKCDTPF